MEAYNACIEAFIEADEQGDRESAVRALHEALAHLDDRVALSVAGLLHGRGYPGTAKVRASAAVNLLLAAR